ncbi:hypothetical protein HDU87_003500, partial [Geranomyces variabilis]
EDEDVENQVSKKSHADNGSSSRGAQDAQFIDDSDVPLPLSPDAAYDPNNDPFLKATSSVNVQDDEGYEEIKLHIAHIKACNTSLNVSIDVKASLEQ